MSEAKQFVVELERTINQLGNDTWDSDPEWCRARLAEFFEDRTEKLGTRTETLVTDGLDREAVREAELWFLLECPLPDGHTPVARLQQERSARAVELLARSELRAWRVEACPAAGPVGACCPLGSGRVRLELARQPLGQLSAGAFIVGRSVPVAPAAWLVLGPAPVVAPVGADAFERLIRSLEAPRGELWRVHGAVLARAAAAWPAEQLAA